jgi:hypothetical protein
MLTPTTALAAIAGPLDCPCSIDSLNRFKPRLVLLTLPLDLIIPFGQFTISLNIELLF